MSELVPAEVFAPGDFIREELKERGWAQADLARIIGRPVTLVHQIVTGSRRITPTTAHELSEAFGTSPELWMNLDSVYQLRKTEVERDAIRERRRIFDYAPIRDMQRRGWIKKVDDLATLTAELCRFFRVPSLDQAPQQVANARASIESEDGKLTTEQTAWCYRALQLATGMQVEQYSRKALDACVDGLRMLMEEPEQVRQVPKVLAASGIRFVIVEHLPRTRIDGAALWLNDRSPVVALSMRYDRIDCFWHTLCHELSHIRNRDGTMLDVDLIDEGKIQPSAKSEVEVRANRESGAMLVPPDELDNFILRVKPYYHKSRISGFARSQHVHPGIVAGQLQHRRETDYSANREMLVKVREIVVSAALTDGWDQQLKIDW